MSVTEMRPVHFTGTRGELFGLLFRGYLLLLLPTLGIYRFWVTTSNHPSPPRSGGPSRPCADRFEPGRVFVWASNRLKPW